VARISPDAREKISLRENHSHEVSAAYDGRQSILRPASEGTGVIAGKTVRAVLDAVGLKSSQQEYGFEQSGNVVKPRSLH
jgi:small subunit ribosomal protein S5